MIVLGSEMILLKSGDLVMVMLARNKADSESLYHYLRVDAFEFKRHVAERMPEVNFLSSGHRTEAGKLEWNHDYIDLPKWYDLN